MKTAILFITFFSLISLANAKKPPIHNIVPDCDTQTAGCDNVKSNSFSTFDLFTSKRQNSDFCRVSLQYRYGNTVQTFSGSPCRSIVNRCNAEILRRHLSDARCVVAGQGDNDNGRQVTMSCKYNAVERDHWGEVLSSVSYNAKAKARNARLAKEKACEKAERKCRNNRRYYEKCERARY